MANCEICTLLNKAHPYIDVAQGTSLFVYLFISLFVVQVKFTYTFKLKKKCRTSIYACIPQFQVWYQSNPGTSSQYKTVHFLHSFHIRTHHKHLYTDLGPISRPPSQKVPDQHICMHPTIPSVVPIEPRHIPTIQNSALFALISHSHSP